MGTSPPTYREVFGAPALQKKRPYYSPRDALLDLPNEEREAIYEKARLIHENAQLQYRYVQLEVVCERLLNERDHLLDKVEKQKAAMTSAMGPVGTVSFRSSSITTARAPRAGDSPRRSGRLPT